MKKIISVLAVIVFAASAVNVIVMRREAEIRAALALADDVTLQLTLMDEEINRNSKLLMSEEDDSLLKESLLRFKDSRAPRIDQYKKLEQRIDGFRSTLAPTAAIISGLGMLTGTHYTLEDTLDHCADSILYSGHKSNGTPMEESCSMETARRISADIFKYTERLDRLYIQARDASFKDKLTMQRAKKYRGPARDGRGNIAIILVDALRADALGCYGGEARTPALDKLAAEGVLFSNIASPSSSTHTSVASLFTGMNPYVAGAIGTSIWQYDKSLVRDIQAAGYHTVAFVGNPVICEQTEYHRGFSSFYARNWAPARVLFQDFTAHWKYEWNGRKPFMMYLHIIDPHDPYFSPDSIPDLVENGRPEGSFADPNIVRKLYISQSLDAKKYVSQANMDYLKSLYIQEVEYADRRIGMVIDYMKENGLMENTTLAIIADHGETFLEHGDVKHSWQLYQESVHVPMIISGRLPKGFKPGETVADPRSLTELLPSLMADIGIPVPERAEAASHLFSGRPGNFPVISVTNGLTLDLMGKTELMALQSGRRKVIVDVKGNQYAFFDLSDNPGETGGFGDSGNDALDLKQRALVLRRDSLSSEHVGQGGNWEIMRKRLKDFGYLQ